VLSEKEKRQVYSSLRKLGLLAAKKLSARHQAAQGEDSGKEKL
jgi:hypothetical protein